MAYLNPYDINVLPGIEDKRSGQELLVITSAMNERLLPSSFPIQLWVAQSERYLRYWSWFRGDRLEETIGTTDKGEPIYRYPLKINPIRSFSRKYASLLFGEVPDTPGPLIKPTVRPKTLVTIGKEDVNNELRDEANWLESVLIEIWQSSNGRALLAENGLLSQFLGGCIFGLQYQPWRDDLLIPIVVSNIYPDYFLPIWSKDSYFDLLESHVVYRIPAETVQLEYGFEGRQPYSIYYEHWTKDKYSIFIDGEPLTVTYNDVRYTYYELDNPFGFVPYVYIPRTREGNFYGSSFVDDVEGLILEYNGRMADLGDAIRKTVHRKWIGKNITTQPKPMKIESGESFINIGQAIPGSSHEPELEPIDAPTWSSGFMEVTNSIWQQLTRESSLGPVVHGEDEGSQRSGLTLSIRMWPSTAVARQQRIFWRDGLSVLHKYMLKMLYVIDEPIDGKSVPADVFRRYDLDVDWLPMIPRDREQQVTELLNRLNQGGMSVEKYVEDIGDVVDKTQEIEGIRERMLFQAEVQALAKPKPPEGGSPAQ